MKNCPYCDRLLAGNICSAHGYVGPPAPPPQAIPKGLICMWSGAATAIPPTWALCDGTNGTPDLRERFILCAGATNAVGATGGSNATHAHSLSVTGTSSSVSGGSHANATVGDHAANTSGSAGDHTHNLDATTGAANSTADGLQSGTGAARPAQAHTHTMDWAADTSKAHTHSTPALSHAIHSHDAHETHSHTVSSSGTSGSSDGRPAFYALAFIQKL